LSIGEILKEQYIVSSFGIDTAIVATRCLKPGVSGDVLIESDFPLVLVGEELGNKGCWCILLGQVIR
jgi:hypothetical protein